MDLSNADRCTVANGQLVGYVGGDFYQAVKEIPTRDIGICSIF